jgi:chemotaxis protein histidine kinase CheA
MTVNLEVKGNLAKLLATENLIIENKQVSTASFDVDRRVLTLPMWQKASDSVYDMLVAHEVGHALYTPNEDPADDVPHQFINITEDVRIEKLIKRKFAGLAKTFYRGYQEMNEDDFFCIQDQNLSEMNLADRINLYFKIGNYVDVPIKDGQEKDILNIIAAAETFDDAQNAARILYKYCKESIKENKEEIAPQVPNQTGAESGMTESVSDNTESEEKDESVETEETTGGSATSQVEENSEEIDEEPEIKTDQAQKSNIEKLVDSTAQSATYLELPEVNLDSIVNSNAKVHNYIQTEFDNYCRDTEQDSSKAFEFVDFVYNKFKKSAQKEVNYLVKEFECKKAADSYARAATARTGVLDCTKLHTYKYSEDIFKKVTTLHDGKNHGLIFILDWSGSMADVLTDTLKQLFNLLWFCKKVGIPFKVYAFTYEFNVVEYTEDGKAIMLSPHFDKKDGLFHVDDRFSLMEFFTSDVSGKVLETQMQNIWRVGYALQFYQQYHCPPRVGLSGTPLNETLVSLHKIIPQFKKQFKTQKVQCVVLTDGEANHLLKCKEVKKHGHESSYVGCMRLSTYNDYFRNPKSGKTFKIPFEYSMFTAILLQDLKDMFSDVNFIGIRVLLGRDASYFIKRYCGYEIGAEYESLMASWRKQKSFSIKHTGYEKYFGLSATALAQDAEFEVKEDATKSQIKSAFQKSLRTKKLNKKVLGEFIDLIV